MRRRFIALLSLFLVASCSRRGATPSSASAAGRPIISSLAPDTVSVAPGESPEFTIMGAGFLMAPTNTVVIGPVRVTQIASKDGSSLRVSLPDRIVSGGEAPPSDWSSGKYPIVVSNSSGQSDTAWIRIKSRMSGRP